MTAIVHVVAEASWVNFSSLPPKEAIVAVVLKDIVSRLECLDVGRKFERPKFRVNGLSKLVD